MNRFLKSITMLAVSSFAFAFLAGCGGNKTLDRGNPDEAEGMYPPAIEKLIQKKYASSIHAVGMGSHPDRITAAKKARLDAQNQIANTFRNEVSALQKSFLEAVNDQQLEEYRNTVESFTNIELQGVSEAKATFSEGKDGYTAYILMTVSAETLKDLIDEKTAKLTNFKALQAYQELEARVEKDKAARAAADEE